MRTIAVCVAILALAGGCASEESAGADAETCADVADENIILLNDVLVEAEEADPSEAGDDSIAVLDGLAEAQAELDARAQELGCDDEEMIELMCDRLGLLEVRNATADALRNDPSCATP